jgi:hypothetical protein
MSSRRRQLRRGTRGRLRGPIGSPPGNVRWAGRKVTSSSHKVTSYSQCSQALFGFLMVPETFLGSPRVHPSHSPTLAERRSPSRSASTTSSHFKDALEHLLEDAAWGLPHAAATTNHEQKANLEPSKPSSTCRSQPRPSCEAPVRNPADSL